VVAAVVGLFVLAFFAVKPSLFAAKPVAMAAMAA
jgi:hypothetical protein